MKLLTDIALGAKPITGIYQVARSEESQYVHAALLVNTDSIQMKALDIETQQACDFFKANNDKIKSRQQSSRIGKYAFTGNAQHQILLAHYPNAGLLVFEKLNKPECYGIGYHWWGVTAPEDVLQLLNQGMEITEERYLKALKDYLFYVYVMSKVKPSKIAQNEQ